MSNMSYCMFQNTVNSLRECYYKLSDNDMESSLKDFLSPEEARAAERLLDICQQIYSEFGINWGESDD